MHLDETLAAFADQVLLANIDRIYILDISCCCISKDQSQIEFVKV